MIIEIPDKNLQLEFPDNMPHADIEAIIQRDIYGQQTPQATQQAQPQGLTMGGQPLFQEDPMVQPETYIPEIGMAAGVPNFPGAISEAVGKFGPEIGLMAGPLMGGRAVLPQFSPYLTKAVSIARSTPGTMALSGLGMAAGSMVKDAWHGETLMKQTTDVPPVSAEDFPYPSFEALSKTDIPEKYGRAFLTGSFADAFGQGVYGVARGAIAPALGKIPPATETFLKWAKERNLDFSLDVVKSWPTQIMQKAADWGLGRYITNYQRNKLIKATSKEAQGIMVKLGLPEPVPGDTALALANYLQKIKTGKATYAEAEAALDLIPKDLPINASNMYKFLEGLGSGGGTQAGLEVIRKVYRSDLPKYARIHETLRDVVDNAGQINFGNIRELGYRIHTGMKKSKDLEKLSFNKEVAVDLKSAFLEDIKGLTAPGYNESVGELRIAADKAYAETQRWLQNSPLVPSLMQRKLSIDKPEQFTNALFSGPYTITAKELKTRLTNSGQGDLWDSLVASKIQSMFKEASHQGALGETFFLPAKFIESYNKNKRAIGELMPDQAAALEQWSNISHGVLEDFRRVTKGSPMGRILAAGMMGGGLYAGSVALVVGAGFSPVAALVTMGPKVNFLQRYLTKAGLTPLEQMMAYATGQAAKPAGAKMIQQITGPEQPQEEFIQ